MDYARRYREALRDARRLRALPATMAFDEAYAVAGRVGITQMDEEIGWLFALVSELRPSVVLEIGLDEGGTLFLWTRSAAPDAHLISIDTRPAGTLGRHSPFSLVRRSFAVGAQRVDLVLGADSHDEATVARVSSLLAGRAVDFLFVDGDHSYEGVSRDFELYAPLVRSGGLVAFHDVSPRSAPMTTGTSQFWREFAASHETESRVVDRQPGFGIGVYRMP